MSGKKKLSVLKRISQVLRPPRPTRKSPRKSRKSPRKSPSRKSPSSSSSSSSRKSPSLDEYEQFARDYISKIPRPYVHQKPNMLDIALKKESQLPKKSISTGLNDKMLSMLYNWMFQVTYKFKSGPEVWNLAVQYVKTVLSKTNVTRDKLQLVGVASIWLASKILDVHPPELRDMTRICANAYTNKQVLIWERHLVNTLGAIVYQPTIHRYIHYLTKNQNMTPIARTAVKKLAGRMATFVEMAPIPSDCRLVELCDACIYFAKKQLGMAPNTSFNGNSTCLKAVCRILSKTDDEIDVVMKKLRNPGFINSFKGIESELKLLEEDCNALRY